MNRYNYYNVPKPKPSKAQKAAAVLLLAVAVSAAIYGISMMKHKKPKYVVVAPMTTPTAPVVAPAPVVATEARPMSTPASLASKYGLGGGPLVGSQSTRLGGSEFLPFRHFYQHDNDLLDRKPTIWSQMLPTVTPAPVVAPATAPMAVPVTAVPTAAPTALPPPIASFMEAPTKIQGFQLGAMPTPYQTADTVYIDTRDGQIIQPR